MSLVVNSHGMGAVVLPAAATGAATPQTVDLSPDNIARCSSGWYYVNPFSCWGMSKESWNAAAGYTAIKLTPSLLLPRLPGAYSATGIVTPAEGQAASDAAIAQTQANALAAFQETAGQSGRNAALRVLRPVLYDVDVARRNCSLCSLGTWDGGIWRAANLCSVITLISFPVLTTRLWTRSTRYPKVRYRNRLTTTIAGVGVAVDAAAACRD